MCNNAVDNNPSTIKDVPDWCNAQELCDKAADDYSIALDFFPDWCKSEEMCEKIISENPFMLMKLLMIFYQHYIFSWLVCYK